MHPRARPTTLDELQALVGAELGPTAWRTMSQPTVDAFADLTTDHQWIHVDPDRAADGPFGGTVAHGLLTLALGPSLTAEVLDLSGFAHSLNYGYGRVRFPGPVRVGSRLRLTATVSAVERLGASAAQLQVLQRFQVEDVDKPVCVAEAIVRVTES